MMAVRTINEINLEFIREMAFETKPNVFNGPTADNTAELLAEISAEHPDGNSEDTGQNKLPEPVQDSSRERSLTREFGALAVKLGIITGVILILFTLVYGLHYNTEPGMNPAIKDGDLVMYYRWDKNYRAGDLILLTFQGQRQVRRVVAAEGDTVDISDEGLVVNGALQYEPEISQKTQRYEEGISFPVTLGENEVFVLGDARRNAADSRIYGSVNIKDTQGKAITLFRRRSI